MLQHVTALLQRYSPRLLSHGVTFREPEIQVWNSDPAGYTSELSVFIVRSGNIEDALEFHIYDAGQIRVTPEQVVTWMTSQLDAILVEYEGR